MSFITTELKKRVKWDYRFLRLAREVASWSKDPSTKVGAVITGPENQVWSLGFNGFPQGVADETGEVGDRNYKYLRMVHAEATERSLRNGTLYVFPFMPCSQCAGVAIQRGITRVVSIANYPERWEASFQAAKDMFAQAKIETSFYLERDLTNDY